MRRTLSAFRRRSEASEAYFVKGSMLFGLGTVQNGKFMVSEAALQAPKQYLVLAPSGPHAADVKAMLDSLK